MKQVKNKHYKIWYTGNMIQWTLDRIISAQGPREALDVMHNSYPWAVIVDWMEINQHDKQRYDHAECI